MGFRAFAGVLLILCAGGSVRAQSADDVIRQGVERRRQGDDAGALRLFEQAYESGHSPRALAQMALAEQALGKWVVASEHLRQALAMKGDPWIAKNRSALNEAAARVADHIGWIEIFGGPPGAEIRLDGAPRGTLPLPRPLAATTGTVAIDLVLAGRLPVRRTTSVRAGETTREAFDALPAAEASGPALTRDRDDKPTAVGKGAAAIEARDTPAATAGNDADETPEGKVSGQLSGTASDGLATDGHASPARVPLVLATAALSVGALVFAVVEHTTWLKGVDSFNNMSGCDPAMNGKGSPTCLKLYDDARSSKKLAFIGYGAAGALAATSVILFFALDEAAPSTSHVACAPAWDAHSVTCALRF